MFKVSWVGLPKLLKKMSAGVMSDPLRRFYDAVTKAVAKEMTSSAPRRSGTLAGSFKPSVNKKDPPAWGKVSNRVKYARHQAVGTSRHSPAGFWESGLKVKDEVAATQVSELAKGVEDEWGD